MSRSPERKRALGIGLALAALAAPVQAQQTAAGKTGLGRPALPAEIRAWDIDVRADGAGLPAGRGSVKEGEALFQARCAPCHGDFGEGTGRFPVLAGGQGSLGKEGPVKTVGSFWPYAATLFDYIRRAKPYDDPRSLTDNEAYAAAAYVLHLNDVVKDDFVFSRETLGAIRMPNAGGFRDDDRGTAERHFWARKPCMKGCGAGPAAVSARAARETTPETQKNRGVD